jgi:hypothetical protein
MVSRTREILFESASGEMITMDSLRPDEQGDLTANNFLMQDQGLTAKGGTQGVGRATTNAVVAASVAVIAVDFFVTRLLITVLY